MNSNHTLIRDSTSLLFVGLIASIVIGTALMIMASLTSLTGFLGLTSHRTGEALVTMAAITAVITYLFTYRGFTKLTEVNRRRYSIGRRGAIVQITMAAIDIAVGTVILTTNITITPTFSPLIPYLVLTEIAEIILGAVSLIFLTTALRRLGKDLGEPHLTNGASIMLIGETIALIPGISSMGGVITLIGLIPALAGLNKIRKNAEMKILSQ